MGRGKPGNREGCTYALPPDFSENAPQSRLRELTGGVRLRYHFSAMNA